MDFAKSRVSPHSAPATSDTSGAAFALAALLPLLTSVAAWCRSVRQKLPRVASAALGRVTGAPAGSRVALARRSPATSPAGARNPYFTAARDTRVELVTLGFGDPRATAVKQGVSCGRDPFVTHPVAADALCDLALGLLHAVDEGHPAAPLARDLAVEVLRRTAPDSPPWTLAVEVLDGGPLRARRAVELAGQVLDALETTEEVRASRLSRT